LNRFERKKNIELAIRAFAVLKKDMENSNMDMKDISLIVAGIET
jgi:glycosyltransferase involved in cell wall biosynthesis